MTQSQTLQQKSEEQVREELRGFPEDAVLSVLRLREDFTAGRLDATVRHVLGFYLPKARACALEALPKETRLREDLGVDSLTMAEAAFKFDELFGVSIETRETAGIETLGDLHAFLVRKLEV
ncbi:MAG: acyl carrier protein [Verrucomicrobiales bacterium]